MASQAPP
ncbi:hypothetical protein HJC23_014053 [Cyclotella cryptica]